MIRYLRIDYVLSDAADLTEYETRVKAFVAAVGAHNPANHYATFREQATPRRCVHVGALVEASNASLQEQPFFKDFAGYMRSACAKGPDVTRLEQVATTA